MFIFVAIIISIFSNCEQPIPLQKIGKKQLKKQLDKFVPVTISYDQTLLSEQDQQVIAKLVQAANYMDRIFLRQVYVDNEKILKQLQASQIPDDLICLDYFKIMYGPWDRLNDNQPFLVSFEKPEGANFYPSGMSKDAFYEWLEKQPNDKVAFESNFTVIRSRGNKLLAIPYSKAYQDLLKPAAKLLREAAELADNKSLQTFLRSRAEAFLSNDYFQSDMDWMDLDSNIEVVIGPYEVYEDQLFGYKAAFEAFITVVDPVESEKLSVIASYLDAMEKNLPYPDRYKNFERGGESPIKVVQEIYTAGDTRAGAQTLAFNLPNDERVREAKGSKKVMLKNVMEAKFNKILLPIAEKVIDPAQLSNITFDAYFNHILLHEVSHGLGPGIITLPDGEKTTVNKMLKDAYSVIEEAKADVCGNFNVQFLINKNVFPKSLEKSLYTTYLAGMFRSVRFGAQSAHGVANMIQFNYLTERNAFKFDSKTKTFRVDPIRIKNAVRDLANMLLVIQAKGDYKAAKNLINNYGVMTETMKAALERLKTIPVDIKPIYEVEAAD